MQVQFVFSGDLAARSFIYRGIEPPTDKLVPKEQEYAIFLGETSVYRKPFFWIPDRLKNRNVFIIGTTGAGKSTTLYSWIDRAGIEGKANVLIIDFTGEYTEYVLDRGGRVIHLGKRDAVNPLDLGGMDPATRTMQVLNSLSIAFDLEGATRQRRKMRELLEEAYKRKGIHPDDPETWNREPPTLKDVYQILEEKIAEIEEEGGSSALKESLISLGEKFVFYISPPNDYFARQSTVKLDDFAGGGLISLNLSELPDKKSKAMVALAILDFMEERMRRDGFTSNLRGVKQYIIIDEPWKIASEKDDGSSPLLAFAKECRKYGYAIIIATQNLNDISPRVVSNLSGMIIILQLENANERDTLCKSFGIPDRIKEKITSYDTWQCAVKLNFKEGGIAIFEARIKPELKDNPLIIRFEEPRRVNWRMIEYYFERVKAKI